MSTHDIINDTSLQSMWKELNEQKFSNHNINKQIIMEALQKESIGTLERIQKNLKFKILWSAAFTLLAVVFTLLAVFHHKAELAWILAALLGIFLSGFVLMLRKYRSIDRMQSKDRSILASMKSNLSTIKSLLKTESIWGILTYSPSLLLGILAVQANKGVSVMQFIQDTSLSLPLLGISIAIIPMLAVAVHYMNNKAFAEDIKQLESHISNMEKN